MSGRLPIVTDVDGELVPAGYRFDVVWRGYQRRQVDAEVRMMLVDRDAAVDMVAGLAGQLEQARSEITELRARLDRLCRAPLAPAALEERLGRLIELAQGEAAAVVARARATAEHVRAAALRRIRHREECAERQRRRVEEDFMIAMAARRKEAMRALREHEAARRAEAERLVRTAQEDARRLVASATIQVEALRETHRRLAERLRMARGLLARACAHIGVPGEANAIVATVPKCLLRRNPD